MASLLDLPNEILDMIARNLERRDLCTFRRTCHTVEAGTSRCFLLHQFSQRYIEIDGERLQRMVDMAHSRVGDSIHITPVLVEYFTDLFRAQGPHTDDEVLKIVPSHGSRRHIRTQLTEAFSHLPNLRKVYLLDCPNRIRTGEVWDIDQGWDEIRQLYPGPTFEEVKDDFVGCLFRTTLTALAESDAARPRVFGVWRRDRVGGRRPNNDMHPCFGLTDAACALPPALAARAEPLLAHLTQLLLTLHLDGGGLRADDRGDNNRSRHVQRLLALCPNLVDLRLDGRHCSLADEQLLCWLARDDDDDKDTSDDLFPAFPAVPAARFPALRLIQLRNLLVTEATLRKLVRKFAPTLRHLDIGRVTLYDAEHARVDNGEGRANPWAGLFRFLADGAELDVFQYRLPLRLQCPYAAPQQGQQQPRRSTRRREASRPYASGRGMAPGREMFRVGRRRKRQGAAEVRRRDFPSDRAFTRARLVDHAERLVIGRVR